MKVFHSIERNSVVQIIKIFRFRQKKTLENLEFFFLFTVRNINLDIYLIEEELNLANTYDILFLEGMVALIAF